MQGLMMDTPLLVSMILRHADLHHPNREIVSVTADNSAAQIHLSRLCSPNQTTR